MFRTGKVPVRSRKGPVRGPKVRCQWIVFQSSRFTVETWAFRVGGFWFMAFDLIIDRLGAVSKTVMGKEEKERERLKAKC